MRDRRAPVGGSIAASLPQGKLAFALPRTVNGTGHTDPSEFCATSMVHCAPRWTNYNKKDNP